MLRPPAVAGQFYAGLKEGLMKEIESCFLDDRGPKSLPKIGKDRGLKGVVAPHAGYMYSGPIAAYSYREIAKNGLADVYVILGPNHTGIGSGVSVYPKGRWKTPLGEVEIDERIVRRIAGGIIDTEESAHAYEHSIEVQIPFLQYIHREKKFSIVPICMAMQDLKTSREVGQSIADALMDEERRAMIIASTDFSHVGFSYLDYPKGGKRVDVYAEEQDRKAIDAILKIDPELLIRRVEDERISMCGYGCVAAMLFSASKLGAKEANLLRYGSSYEVSPGDSCVGYGAIAVY